MKEHSYTIAEVAKMLGVSPSTVSRAMNNSPGVSKAVREKILDFVDEIGYHPNTIAQSLSRGTSNMVALILGDIRNPFYSDLAFYIQRHLTEQGYIVTTFNSEYDPDKEAQYMRIAQQYSYGGIILVTVNSEAADKYLTNMDIPLLMVNRITSNYDGSLVVTDNFQAGYIATRHLINLGHKEIGFISGHHQSSTASYDRYRGFRQALSNYHLEYREEYCSYNKDWRLETGYQAAEEYFAKDADSRPTALLLANDLLAIGFMDYCGSHGIKIPEELSIISFDNIEYANLSQIQLTTVSQHVELMSEEAAQLMVSLMTKSQVEPKRIILEPTLVIRKTTGPCPGM
ncbi:substrate-binding domain-containing protein [Lactonifactor sp. BIOML-A3]|uniref:LacI family DNA-binding transcriptional regulator n=1 Tax=unclassified Lactonifactor TaxID=2636670 RepID=UPI0012AF471F|nr:MULTISPECIES: LacI family DNA-binding transcriptional regulator [unclassified Lactonifactor]MSA00679.1 substrate-binding domain-containing protein [Lactonifactor sp. BIOML-A5]MSA06877.1 substrate-binding domain-containing protein [Lactonifactor sp. BIOML-A4]MSA11516.1 substrate-binding domain-containing protein [Lactonifactor sp. BIOML-A3]MSA16109.1 substrate-binding domain-containing protein [Lactonifactor sp. BIOML-A2]MSA36713.1 substrate-binding domain-containing protein [Lactonifactor s